MSYQAFPKVLRLAVAVAVLCFFGTVGLVALHAGDELSARKPTVGLIDVGDDKAFGDLLFAELSKDDSILLVERDRFALIRREHEYSSASGAANIELGQLLKADGLLFIEPAGGMLHAVLVETARGKRIFDLAFPAKTPAESIISMMKGEYLLWKEKLVTPAESRIYVSLMPALSGNEISKTKGAEKSILLFNTLLSMLLRRSENIFVLDRWHLDSVYLEKGIASREGEDEIAGTDYVIRTRGTIEGDMPVIELKAISARGGEEWNLTYQLEPGIETKSAEAAAGHLLEAFSRGNTRIQKTNPKKEAKYFYDKGCMFINSGEAYIAVKYYGIAYLLDPQYKHALIHATVRYLGSRASFRYVNGEPRVAWASAMPEEPFSVAEYMQMIRALTMVMNLETRGSSLLSYNSRVTFYPYTFLAESYERFSAVEIDEIKECRRALLNTFRRYVEYKLLGTTESQRIDRLLYYSPILFETPDECIGEIASLINRLSELDSIPSLERFAMSGYWNRQDTRAAWLKFMEGLFREDSKQLQLYSLKALASRYAPDRMGSEGADVGGNDAVVRMVKWLNDDANFDWLLRNPSDFDGCMKILFDKLIYFDTDFQARSIGEVCLKAIERKFEVELNDTRWYARMFLAYIRERYKRNARLKGSSGEIAVLKKLVEDGWAIFSKDVGNIAELKELFTNSLATFPEFQGYNAWRIEAVVGKKAIEDEVVSGGSGELLHEIVLSGLDYKGRVEMLYDEGSVWFVAYTSPGYRIVRFDRDAKVVNDVHIQSLESFSMIGLNREAGLVRFKDYLCIPGDNQILLLPVRNSAPYFDVSGIKVLDPRIGDWTLGAGDGDDRGKTITSISGSDKHLYIGVSEGVKTTYAGAIFRWDPGSGDFERVCASSSPGGTPLDDCKAYEVVACSDGVEEGDMFFYVSADPPLSGVWRQGGTGEFKQMESCTYFSSEMSEFSSPFQYDDVVYVPLMKDCLVYDQIELDYDRVRLFTLTAGLNFLTVLPDFGAEGGAYAITSEKDKTGIFIDRFDREGGRHTLSRVCSHSALLRVLPTSKGLIASIAFKGDSDGKSVVRFYMFPDDSNSDTRLESKAKEGLAIEGELVSSGSVELLHEMIVLSGSNYDCDGGVEMLYDGGSVWFIAYTRPGFRIVRFDLEGKVITDVAIKNLGSFRGGLNRKAGVARFKDYLCISGNHQVLLLPVRDTEPYLDVSGMKTLGPRIGDWTLGVGGTHDRSKKITCVSGGHKYLYIGVSEGFKTTYAGAVFRWDPGSGDFERVCASNSLGGTPLDDCIAYELVAFSDRVEGGDMFFYISSYPPLSGIWRRSGETGEFKQMESCTYFSFERSEFSSPFQHDDVVNVPLMKDCLVYDQIELDYDRVRLFTLTAGLNFLTVLPDFGAEGGAYAITSEKDKTGIFIDRFDREGGRHTLLRICSQRDLLRVLPTPKGLIASIFFKGDSDGKSVIRFYMFPSDSKSDTRLEPRATEGL